MNYEPDGPRTRERILQAIEKLQSSGAIPSVRAIGELAGLRSSSTVHAHLRTLVSRGKVRKAMVKGRASYVSVGGTCPMCGRPNERTETAEE